MKKILKTVWQLFIFAMGFIGLALYVFWCWIRGKKAENPFR